MEKQPNRLNVVVVDDDDSTVEVFSEILELNGINVMAKGYDGKDAVNLYSELKPDIVLLDVMMPKYDGIYALEKIREINPHAVVIMVTADVRCDTTEKLEEMNASSIVNKPFDIEQLIETIDKLVIKAMKS